MASIQKASGGHAEHIKRWIHAKVTQQSCIPSNMTSAPDSSNLEDGIQLEPRARQVIQDVVVWCTDAASENVLSN